MANPLPVVLSQRREYSIARLAEFSDHLARAHHVGTPTNLCIYVTGSFGRLEATPYSDLDIFFVQTSDAGDTTIGKVEKTLLDAEIIGIAERLRFPPFSRDGEFLEVHQLSQILEHLGSPQDDFENYFTARLLLLLESRAVWAEEVYNTATKAIVDAYYRDYHDHAKDFLPIFLVNDILRFWKTLCLNYEHRRNRPTSDQGRKAKSHLKNLKLKFSRMMTCFSAVAWIAAAETGPGPDEVLRMVRMTPLDRLLSTVERRSEAQPLVDRLLTEYTWFLEKVGLPEEAAVEWIAAKDVRSDAFTRARIFGDHIYELIATLAGRGPMMRYLLV